MMLPSAFGIYTMYHTGRHLLLYQYEKQQLCNMKYCIKKQFEPSDMDDNVASDHGLNSDRCR